LIAKALGGRKAAPPKARKPRIGTAEEAEREARSLKAMVEGFKHGNWR
jgi:hypothetical protein